MRLLNLVAYAAIAATGLIVTFTVQEQATTEYRYALEAYKEISGERATTAQRTVEDSLNQIYVNLRTISMLPSVRDIDRHGTNIDANARLSIQQIYNNLASSVEVSEVYIIPRDFQPDAYDPVTGKLELPIVMFDELITAFSPANPSTAAQAPRSHVSQPQEEIESFEFRQLQQQAAWFRTHYASAVSIVGMQVPFLASDEVVTCDNTIYNETLIEADRKGVAFSVPFYGADGNYKGMISAILRTGALRSLLPTQDLALVNSTNGFIAPSSKPGQQHASLEWASKGQPDPRLLFSRVLPVSAAGVQGPWKLWVGHANSDFLHSREVKRIKQDALLGNLITFCLTALGFALWTFTRWHREAQLAQWRDLSTAAIEGLAIYNGDKLVTSNSSFDRMVGLPTGASAGLELATVIEDADVRWRAHHNTDSPVEGELTQSSGRKVPVEMISRNIKYQGRPHRVLAIRDLRERKKAEEEIRFLALHDPLTKLANRVKLRDELTMAIARVKHGESFAVLCLDLDEFKQVNDTLGHPCGDKLLEAVASRLGSCVRKGDIVARLGGDEFAIIQAGVEQPAGATTLANRLIERISEPYVIDGQHMIIGASIGIALAPNDGEDADELLKNADLALYRAKSEGRRQFHLFEAGMDASVQDRRLLELDLRRALAQNQFEMFYQPLVCAASHRVTGFEALLRWRHPERGLVSPADFIPLAEQMGLMGSIGAWVLAQACRDAADWPDHVRVAVNISATQFKGRPLDLDVIAALGNSGLPASRLELEITETVLLENTEATLAMLGKLRELGIAIAIDDFGTGYSSLSYLSSFPFDKIKIDRSFTSGSAQNANATAVVRAVIGLGASLGISTLAEGVETQEQSEWLTSEGCEELQGFWFSRPLPASELHKLMAVDKGTMPASMREAG